MFNLIGWNDISEILDLKDEESDDNYLMGVIDRAVTKYRDRAGFFTPYEDSSELAAGFLAPFWYPLASSVGIVVAAFTAAVAACYCVGSLLLTCCYIVSMDTEARNEALESTLNGLALTGLALLGVAAAVMLTVFSIPHSLFSFISRSTASVVEAINPDCFEENQFRY